MRNILAVVTAAVVALVIASPAVGETRRETIPFEATITDCGNTIHISGEVLAIFHVTETPSGGLLIATHFKPQNVRGTDELGRLYIGTGVRSDVFVSTPAGVGTAFTVVDRFHIVGTAGAPTFYAKETFHVTVTPSGEFVTVVDKISVECR